MTVAPKVVVKEITASFQEGRRLFPFIMSGVQKRRNCNQQNAELNHLIPCHHRIHNMHPHFWEQD